MAIAISPALLDSDAAAKERQYARDLGKPLIPVLIAPVLSDVLPPDLAALQFIDYTNQSQTTAFQLASALMMLPPPQPLPDPLPESPAVPVSYMSGLGNRIRAAQLTVEEQLSLVAELRHALQRPRQQEAALELLRKLGSRLDLYHVAGQEIDELLRNASAGGLEPVPTAAPPGWYSDPARRHQFRWFDGDWTPFVSDTGDDVSEDPNF